MWYARQAVVKQDNDIESIPEMEMIDRRRADKFSDEPVWQKLHSIADDHEDDFREHFLEATGNVKDELILERMKEGFEAGDVNQVMRQVDWQNYGLDLEPLMRDYTVTIQEAGQDVIAHLPPNYRNVNFNINHPRVIEYVQERSGFLIEAITEGNRRAVRNIITDAHIRGYHPDVAARHIRNVVGLTDRQSRAVDNYVNRLIEDGVPQRHAFERGEEYSERLLDYRAERIARTETMEAVNTAQHETILQGVEQDIIPEADTIKRYLVTPDDRLCDFCSPVEDQEQDIRAEFTTPLGNFQYPPIHPNCRCSVTYSIND